MTTQQVAPVSCSNCGAQFTAPIQSIVNGQDVELKSVLLQGGLNVAQCPQCGFTSMMNVPVLYYDLEKELAFVLAPSGLHMAGPDQDKIIGNLTNALVNSLPSEQRRFYLLNPKQFLTLDSMAKAILEADGITPEVFEAQTARARLIEEFLQISDEATLREKAKAHDAELDRQFFEILTASIQQAQLVGNAAGARALLALRTMLAEWSSQGRQAVADIDAELGLLFIKSQEELLEKLQAAENEAEFEALLAVGYQLLDYGFFQKLTAQIDEASQAKDAKKVKALTELRTKILEVKDHQEKQFQAALEKSTEILKEVLQSGQPEKVLAQKLDEIDETFFMILSANIEEARRQKQNEAVQALTVIGDMAITMLKERSSPQEEAEEPVATPKIHIAR